MNKYLIELSLPDTDRFIRIPCEAVDSDDANNLSKILAGMMPSENVYDPSVDEYYNTAWQGSVETVWD